MRPSRWTNHEHYRGYAVMSLPFSSGHQMGLRVFPENDFAPYASVWHRTPDGDWSIYNDGPSLQTTCPRMWGPALRHSDLTRIEVTWTGPRELRIEMEKPQLSWTMKMTDSPLLRILNAMNSAMPPWMWRFGIVRLLGESFVRRFLGMGDLRFSFVTPTGHDTTLIPEKIFFIESSAAVLERENLGLPVRRDENPTIAGVPLPTRPTFLIGQAQARIRNRDEYESTRRDLGGRDAFHYRVSEL